MRARPLKRWTLRELINESDRLCRELVEHYERDYYASTHDLEKVLRPNKKTQEHEAADITVYNTARRIRKSEKYASELVTRLDEILNEIHNHIERDF